ncbi:sialate O-acetylesterase [Polyangium sorediatum]|uniref:Sialate O-acetylesterase n=1 Tax=Polyangium sorediatum TaxID=889274 RepID=A0ABT6NXX2_9BACT|nr:sialate O-acetylesterase [Polyangium sorediatum]MDI1433174.1 sialate O-acetylesterase [Polyangium sorediatum]
MRSHLRAAALLALPFAAGALAGALVFRHVDNPAPAPRPEATIPARVTLPPEHLGALSLFVLAGQSNMSGRATLPSPLPAAVPGVYIFGNDGRWHEGREPVDFAEGQIDDVSADPGAGAGPSVAFAAALRDKHKNRPIGLVPCAKGGSSLAEWGRHLGEHTLYGSCLKRARAASTAGTVSGVLFYQGETDAMDPAFTAADAHPDPSKWAGAFESFVADLRRDLGAPDLPVVFAELGPRPTDSRFPAWEHVKEQQRAVGMPGVARIRTDDLPLQDAVHFGWEGQEAIGRRFAEAMEGLLGR